MLLERLEDLDGVSSIISKCLANSAKPAFWHMISDLWQHATYPTDDADCEARSFTIKKIEQ